MKRRAGIWLLFLFLFSIQIFAAEVQPTADLPDGSASLTVQICYNREEDQIPLSQVHFSVCQAAKLQVNGGSAEYTWLPAFEQIGMEIAGMSAQESSLAAKQLEQIAMEKQVEKVEAVTGQDGCAETIQDLDPGLYLVYQLDSPVTEEGKIVIAPYLIQVPQPDPANGNGWIMDVKAYPKAVTPEATEVNLQLTKRVKKADGTDEPTDQTFYFAVYTDEAHTQLLQEISENPAAVEMKGFSVQVKDLTIKKQIDPSEPLTLYIVEVKDEKGTPLGSEEAYTPDYEKHAIVTYRDMTGKSVTIVNKAVKDETGQNSSGGGSTGGPGGGSGSGTGSVKTGDSTPVMLYAGLMILSLLVLFTGFRRTLKREK